MARFDPPSRTADIERTYRRLERHRARPSLLASRVLEHLPRIDHAAVTGFGAAIAVAMLFLGLAYRNTDPLAELWMWACPAPVLLALAIRAGEGWLKTHSATPPRQLEGLRTLKRAADDPRLMAVVRRWMDQSGLGSLSELQVGLLDAAMDRLACLRQWEADHLDLHQALRDTHGIIDDLKAQDMHRRLDGALPQGQGPGFPSRRL